MNRDNKYNYYKSRVRDQKQILIKQMKPQVEEEVWDKFLRKGDKDECLSFYFDKYPQSHC
jgi:DnaJ-domain-containing protein 1